MENKGRVKVVVQVLVEFSRSGDMLPREILWLDENGEERRYLIDRVKDIRQAAANRAGGLGDRYTIVVNGRETYLFFDRSANRAGTRLGTWFVERRSA